MNRPPSSGYRRESLASLLAATVAWLGLAGCATWSHSDKLPDNPWTLKPSQMSPDAVVLEIALVPLPIGPAGRAATAATDDPLAQEVEPAAVPLATAESWESEVWPYVDEQGLPPAVRRRLAANGLRGGILDGQLPPALQTALDAHVQSRQAPAADSETSLPAGIQRLQNRAGKRGKVLTGEVHESLSVLIPDDGRLKGRTLHQAQCLLSVRSFPRGDGQVDLEVTPEIEHGEARQRWLGEAAEGSFRLNTSRDRYTLDDLRMQLRLGPGQLLILGPAQPWKGLGRQFFVDGPQDTLAPRILVVRLAQTQLDDLFTPERSRTKLATETD